MERLFYAIEASPFASALFVLTLGTSLIALANPRLKEKLMLRPHALVHEKKFLGLLGSGFVHADFHHLFLNMLSFYFFAFGLEGTMGYLQVLAWDTEANPHLETAARIWGHAKFFLLYMISMVVADLSTIYRHRNNPEYASLGASGAISALVMSAVILAPSMGNRIMIFGFLPGWIFALLYIGYSYFASLRLFDKVAHEAHLWGALSGIALSFAFFPHDAWIFVLDLIESAQRLFGG